MFRDSAREYRSCWCQSLRFGTDQGRREFDRKRGLPVLSGAYRNGAEIVRKRHWDCETKSPRLPILTSPRVLSPERKSSQVSRSDLLEPHLDRTPPMQAR